MSSAPVELSPRVRALALQLFRPMELIFKPVFTGLEHLPKERPLMFVGNHQLLSFDAPFLVAELWRQNIVVRSLADDFLFVVPAIAWALRYYGVLRASPEAASALLRRGESLLVYPGGAREASKNAGHDALDWWDRLGFARLALLERCTIVPVAAIGVDDRVSILLPPERYLQSPAGRIVDRLHLRRDMFLPIFVPTGLPRPAFHVCPAISVHPYLSRDRDSAARSLRADTAKAIEKGLLYLRGIQSPTA